jgi:hypothetical protein
LKLFPDVHIQMKQIAKKRRDHHLKAQEDAKKNNADKNSAKLLKAAGFT